MEVWYDNQGCVYPPIVIYNRRMKTRQDLCDDYYQTKKRHLAVEYLDQILVYRDVRILELWQHPAYEQEADPPFSGKPYYNSR